MWNSSFNLIIISWLSQYSQVSPKFNYIISYIEHAYAFKGLAVMSMLWYLWFKSFYTSSKTKTTIIGTIISCVIALLITSAINYITPFQFTPIANKALNFQSPIGSTIDISSNTGHGWINSFPSHHATMFYALAMGIFFVSKRLGYFAFLYITLFIILPRLYLGLHYPTDVLAGAAVGILTTTLFNQKYVMAIYERPIISLLVKYPSGFQTLLFIITFEIAVIFNDATSFLRLLLKQLLK